MWVCAMIGAITLSRVYGGTDRSDEILKVVRQSILDLEARGRAGLET